MSLQIGDKVKACAGSFLLRIDASALKIVLQMNDLLEAVLVEKGFPSHHVLSPEDEIDFIDELCADPRFRGTDLERDAASLAHTQTFTMKDETVGVVTNILGDQRDVIFKTAAGNTYQTRGVDLQKVAT